MKDVDILKEINQNAKMGMDSLTSVIKKVNDGEFKDLLNTQHNEYQNIFDRSQELLVKNNVQMKDTPSMQKAMSWMGIQLNTAMDSSNSKISELLIQGNDMGIVKGTKLLNNYSFMNNEIKNIVSDFVRLQQKNIDDLNNQILILENQNKELGSYIKQQGYYPLILKGNEKEFYKGEQRDLLLYLLKEELKNNHNQKQQQIIHTILEQNPPVGNRNRYLTDIFNLLVNEGLSKKSIDTLSRYGIILNHTGKHPTTTFFNDSRYTMTFSSTPSDLNVGRQYYRQIRKLFF